MTKPASLPPYLCYIHLFTWPTALRPIGISTLVMDLGLGFNPWHLHLTKKLYTPFEKNSIYSLSSTLRYFVLYNAPKLKNTSPIDNSKNGECDFASSKHPSSSKPSLNIKKHYTMEPKYHEKINCKDF